MGRASTQALRQFYEYESKAKLFSSLSLSLEPSREWISFLSAASWELLEYGFKNFMSPWAFLGRAEWNCVFFE